MNVTISHPTDRPNFTEVHIGPLTVWFSYKTPIGYQAESRQVVRQNDWSNTTGRHLNWIDNGNKEARVTGEEFEIGLSYVCDRLSVPMPVG